MTVNSDLMPLATAHGYRPVDASGVAVSMTAGKTALLQQRGNAMKSNPFNTPPNAWLEVAIFILAALFLAYGLWVIWPLVSVVWLAVTW